MRIYLCGPINGCTDDEAISWRERFKESSLDDALYPQDVVWVDPMKRDYRGKELTDYREIVDLDKLEVLSSDCLVVMYVKPSVGTSMEVLLAWQNGIPVLVIDQQDKPLSPWLLYHSTSVVKTIDQAIEKIAFWYGD